MIRCLTEIKTAQRVFHNTAPLSPCVRRYFLKVIVTRSKHRHSTSLGDLRIKRDLQLPRTTNPAFEFYCNLYKYMYSINISRTTA